MNRKGEIQGIDGVFERQEVPENLCHGCEGYENDWKHTENFCKPAQAVLGSCHSTQNADGKSYIFMRVES